MSCPHRTMFSCEECIKESIRAAPIGPFLHERIKAFEDEIAQLKSERDLLLKIREMAQELISEFNSYSTGCACLAEEDVAELFGKYTETLEAYDEWKGKQK